MIEKQELETLNVDRKAKLGRLKRRQTNVSKLNFKKSISTSALILEKNNYYMNELRLGKIWFLIKFH